MGTIDVGDILLKVGKPFKYLTNNKTYKVVIVNDKSIGVIDDEGEELTCYPLFCYKRLIKVYKA